MTASKIAAPNNSRIRLLLAIIIALGFALRIWAIDFGLPFPYHMEEPFYVPASWNLACKGDLDSSLLQPHTYLLALSIALSEGLHPTVSCDTLSALSPFFLLLGRLISVGLGTATIVLVYKLGKSLFSTPVGLIGALFTSLNFLHVRESHYGTPDVTTVFLVTATLLSYVQIAQKDTARRRYIVASILTALSINGRPTDVFLMLPFAYAHLLACSVFQSPSWRRLRDALCSPRIPLSAVAMLVTLVVVHPRLWVNPPGVLRYWYDFLTIGSRIRYAVDPLPAPLFYLRTLEWGSGLPLTLVMVLGFIWAVRRRAFADILLLGFIVPYFAFASISNVYFARYVIPILPLLGLLAATFLWEVLPKSQQMVWATVVVLILLIQPVARIGRYDSLLMQTDTRTLAKNWIERNIREGAKMASEWHGPFIEGYDLTVVDFYGLSEGSVEGYRQEGYEYLIVSSFIRDFTMASPEEEAHKRAFYTDLANTTELVIEFRPYSGTTAPQYMIDQTLGPITSLNEFERPGPTIEIYRLR